MDKFEFFKSLGFSDYESKTLVSLTKLKRATAKELSLDSGVPQNKLYFILKKFQEQGILSLVSLEPKKYELINIKSFINSKIKEKEDGLKELKKSFKDIEKVQDKEEQFVFSLIKGQRAIMNKLVEINKKTEKEILGVQRNWKYWGEGIRTVEKAIKKGVDVKFIGAVNDKNYEKVKEWKKIGCKIKAYNKKFGPYPLRFSIFDKKFARITIGKPEIRESKEYITILTDSKPFVRMLRNQFMQMWKECKKI